MGVEEQGMVVVVVVVEVVMHTMENIGFQRSGNSEFEEALGWAAGEHFSAARRFAPEPHSGPASCTVEQAKGH
ncbi:hypothetical protein N7462_003797 [Penicillium macrosclerotiorum]|uniref:uncharacterized protein n=1 Tax=Penicillium macrosclerotiorum TaxID=303699 RepID=UPI002546D896|nr:uncharacterized protein N7462_003797 [Penicillium macrosclerotiorum]KAJ5689405.1 hypothetical protein N7462_003797 [Penicillium macrosclerotiorum]